MKKIILLLLFFLPFLVKATTYTSTGTGGNWTTPATWGVGSGYPGAGDIVFISASTTVTLTANESVSNITINSGGTLAGSTYTLTVYGSFSNSGTLTQTTTGTIAFSGTSAQTITGPVTFNNLTVSSTSTVTLVSSIKVSATFLLSSGTFDVSSSNCWLTVLGNFTNNGGTFNAEHGTVTLGGNGTLGGTSSTTFYNLTDSTHTCTLGNNVTITENFTISAGTFVTSTYSMTIGGNFTNNGTFTNSGISSIITFNSPSANQTIGGSSTTTFHSVIINTGASTDSIILGNAIGITDSLAITSGSLASENHTISGNGTGTLTMAAGTNMVLGNSSGTGINFPSLFIAAHITLNVNSTVTYQTGGTQSVSFVPTYGNLVISGTGTKTPSSTPMNIAGNLTINSVATLSEGSVTINLTGNLSLAGTFTCTSGTLNIAGNFTNNGTFTSGTSGTVVFNGTAGQTIGGAAMTAFHNLTLSSSGTETITMGNNESVANTFLASSGTFTLSGSIYTLSIAGAFTSNASFTATSGTIVMDATVTAQTLSGTSAPTFYNFTVNCTSTLTVSMTTPITINNNLSITSGKLSSEIYQITGNSTGTMSMSAGTTLLLGLTSSAINVSFPTGYSTITLDPNSTVTYQAWTSSQSISVTPTYGNLIISSGTTSVVKTLSGTLLAIAGDLTVNANVTFSITTDTINLTGNMLLAAGTISFTSGPLNIGGNLTNNGGTYTSSSGTTTFDNSSGANQTIGGSHGCTMYNIIIDPSFSIDSVIITSGMTINNNFTISNGTFASKGVNITGSSSGGRVNMAAGTDLALGLPTSTTAVVFPSNYTNANIILNSTSTITYAANANQTVSAAPSYANLIFRTGTTATTKTVAAAFSVADSLTINSSTTLNCQTFQITGNTSGTFSMGSGSVLLLGQTTSTNNVSFPTNFTTAHTSLNSNSTVKYLAETSSQAISTIPTYGNLVISTGSTASKSLLGTPPLTIAGYLTVNSNVTLSAAGNTINLTGNDSIKGTESFSSGALNIGGNFINNGIYTYGTGTTTFNGTGTQTIGGTTTTTFYNLGIAGTGTVQPAYALTITKNLAISSGTFDVTSSNWSIGVAGNFTNTGGTFNPRACTVTMNGGTQTLGGSATLGLYNLIIYSGSNTTLGGNITLASNLTINSSATLNGSSYNMSITGNYTDNGTFNCNTGTVTFNANGKQCIADPSGPETFKNVTVYSTSHLGATCTVDLTGLLTILPGGTMACNCN